jgi:TetR/AcrR family transcriptional regulator
MALSRSAALQKTRIQEKREKRILDCALEVFATYGFHGATLDQIAAKSGISKPNLLYYFDSKEHVYRAVLEQTMDGWLDPLIAINPSGDPASELTRYIEAKMDMAFANPMASRLFAMEVQGGAPILMESLRTSLRSHVDSKTAVIQSWMDQGKLRRVDPHHLIFAIWSLTQHYADYAVQVEALIGANYDRPAAKRAVVDILIRGLTPV